VFDHVRRVHGQALTDDVARCPFSNYRLSPVVAGFDGGNISSDAGGLLLGATDRAIKVISACFQDARRQDLIEHEVATRWRAATRACPELSNSACLVWRPVASGSERRSLVIHPFRAAMASVSPRARTISATTWNAVPNWRPQCSLSTRLTQPTASATIGMHSAVRRKSGSLSGARPWSVVAMLQGAAPTRVSREPK
jgi:hypothetical protein